MVVHGRRSACRLVQEARSRLATAAKAESAAFGGTSTFQQGHVHLPQFITNADGARPTEPNNAEDRQVPQSQRHGQRPSVTLITPGLHYFLSKVPTPGGSVAPSAGEVSPEAHGWLKMSEEGSLTDDADAARTFFIETYGCQMNVSDTEVVRAVLLEAGYREAGSLEEAGVVFANTCAIRENAENKVWNRLMEFRALRRKHRRAGGLPKVGVLGCMAERLKGKLLENDLAHLVAGPDAYRDLPRLLQVVQGTGENAVNVQLSQDETYADITPVRLVENSSQAISAFVSIMRGCNNMCTYCIVPFTRGRERSTPLASVVDEVRRLRDAGVKEVTLLGQNVNSYHDKSSATAALFPDADYRPVQGFVNTFRSRGGAGAYFGDLLHAVADVDPEMRIRFTSPHPKDFPDEVLQAVADRPNICKQLHLPAQSGSTSVLASMRRGYSREAYLALVEQVRHRIPGVALSTDFISGFCGETEEDHLDTLSLMEAVKYEQAYMYAYSVREKTRAAYRLTDDVPADVKGRRLREVIDTFHRVVAEKNQSEVGQRHLVLVEGPSRKTPGVLTGRTDTNKRVLFPEAAVPCAASGTGGEPLVQLQPGDYAVVQVSQATGHTLRGSALARTSLQQHSGLLGRHRVLLCPDAQQLDRISSEPLLASA